MINDNTQPQFGLTRRQFVKAGLLTAASLPFAGMLAACGKKEPSTVIYAGYGGPYEDAMRSVYFEPFAAAQEMEVKVTTGAMEFDKIRTMVRNNNVEYDVVDATGPIYARMLADDLLEPMPDSLLEKLKADAFNDPDGIDAFSFPLFAYSHCIFWNKELTDGRPMQSWKDVWDVEKFPGKRLFQRYPYYVLEEALMADGVKPSDLYPLDIPRALKKLDDIRPHAEFLESNAIQNLVAQGEVLTGDMNLARVRALIADGIPLDYTWDETIIDYVRWVVLKGAPHADNAWKLVEAALDAGKQVDVFKQLGYAPTLKQALQDPATQKQAHLAGDAGTLQNGVVLSSSYYQEHGEEARKAMHDWIING